MSQKIKPSFKVDGKNYELVYTKDVRLKYWEMSNEKKNDSQYQQEIAEYTRLQEQFETIQKKYKQAETEYLDDILNEDKEKAYNKFSELYKKKFEEFTDYVATHKAPTEADKYVLDMLEKLVILALQEKPNELSEKDAEEVWCSFVDENGQNTAMEFLAYLGKVWLTDIDEDTENPFIQQMREKAIQADNRKAGMAKIKK